MKIAIIGAGGVGQTLAKRFLETGAVVTFGVRDPADAKNAAAAALAPLKTPAAAASAADIVLLALPSRAPDGAITDLGDLTGKIVIDATNPINATFSGLDSGDDRSGGERTQRLAPGARVVKAFNTIGTDIMADPSFAGGRPALAIAGDDADAKAIVSALAAKVGFAPYDAGPLVAARSTEAVAWHWIEMAIKFGRGRQFAFALLER